MTHDEPENFLNRTQAEQLVTPGEAERACGLPAGFLATSRRGSSGPPYRKLGRRSVYYFLSEVRAWLDACASDRKGAA